MLTAWGRKLLPFINVSSSMVGNPIPSLQGNTATIRKACIEGKNYEGTTRYLAPTYYQFDNALVYTLSNSSTGIAVGSGDSTPTENDYSLETMLTNVRGSSSPANSHAGTLRIDYENSTASFGIDVTVTNNDSASITIKEIGCFAQMYYASALDGTPSSSNKDCIMLDRTLLETPITIPAGESAVIRYEFIASIA